MPKPAGGLEKEKGKEREREKRNRDKTNTFVTLQIRFIAALEASGAWQHRRCLERCNRAITVSTSLPPSPSPAPTPPLPSLRRRVTTRMKIVITRTVATIIASVSRLQFATVWKRSGDYSTNHLVTFNYRSCSLPPPPSSKSRESSTLENVAEFLPSPLLRTG